MLSKRLVSECCGFIMLMGAAACAQPIAAPIETHDVDAVPVANLQAIAEEIANHVSADSSVVTSSPRGPTLSDAQAFHQRISPAMWRRLEAEAQPRLPALVTEVTQAVQDE